MSNQLTDAVAIDDNRAVAPVIGFVILFGFLIITLSLYQAQAVPQQNSEVEFQHFEEARNDLVELRAGILQAGSTDQSQYRTVRLGTTYPTRMFAINPPPPAGTIRTTEAYPITISNGSGTAEGTVTIPTRFVQYQPGYNELDQSSIWYDASALYVDAREGEGGVAVIEDQELVADDGSVRVVAVQNEFRRSGVSRVTLELRPAEGVTGRIPEGDLNVTVPTRLSDDEYWDESGISSDAYSVTDDTNGDGVHNLTIETTASNLTVDTVGVQEAPEDPTQNDNARIGGGGSGDAPDDEDEDDSVGSVPDEAVAYADPDDDLEYDSGETTYTESELSDFDEDVNLVIPSDVGGGKLSAEKISIDANKITSRVDYEATKNKIDLNGDAGVDITGSTIDSDGSTDITTDSTAATLDEVTINGSGNVKVTASRISATDAKIGTEKNGVTLDTNSGVDITGSTVDSDGSTVITTDSTAATLDEVTIDGNGKVEVTAGRISATDTKIETEKNGVKLDAESGPIQASGIKIETEKNGVELDAESGPIQASGIRIDAPKQVDLIADGDIRIDDTTDQESKITTGESAEAEFDSSSRTFFVDGVEIADDDSTLIYIGDNITVDGETEDGDVEPK